MKEEKINKIMDTLKLFQYKRDVIQVFRDCIESMALQIAIACDLNIKKDNIEKFDHIFDEYKKDDKQITIQLRQEITDLLTEFQEEHDDYLGELYMNIIHEYGNPRLSQFFTPYYISHFMAEVIIGNEQEKKKLLTINDPCCGSGGLCVACLELLKERNINYLQNVLIIANDIDKTCVYMTYLQLSFAGAAAIIEHQDTLTQETWDTFRTLGYYIQQSQNKEEMA